MSDDFSPDVVVDGRACILGRVASIVADRALEGESIAVVNAEEMVVTGREEDVVGRFEKRTELGSDRGPYYPKRPDEIAKRSIRGMVPHRRPRGREAMERVRVYLDNPFEAGVEVLDGTSLDRLSNTRFVELGEVSKRLGATVTW